MYKLSVPIMASTVTAENRESYVTLCRKAGVERIFLAVDSSDAAPISTPLSESVSYFQSQGFEVGTWTDTIGHGFVLSHAEEEAQAPAFQPIVDITGSVRHHANCPLDPSFQKHIAKRIAGLAKTGATIVMLDDDFRMSQHGGELCCACELHLKRISEQLGEEITRNKIKPYILSGKPNPYRNAWISAQKDGLVELAKAIRKEVDEVAPHVTVCCCTAVAPWNVDGVDMVEISKILASKNPPILRLTGAPYWATKKRQFPLIATFEVARMLASFAEQKGVELMSEGDVYPRPRYTCPASYLELYDAVTRIDGGYDGILKYMFDYLAGPELELGYLEHHKENQPYIEKLVNMFGRGANAGVRIVTRPHTYQNADLDLGKVTDISPRPLDATMLGSCSIPTVYRGQGVCNSVFGENVRDMALDQLKNGTILDAVSAVILSERGIDVGLRSYSAMKEQCITSVCTNDAMYKSFVSDGEVRVLPAVLCENAEPLLFVFSPQKENTLAYRYENKNGERFLVFLFDGDSIYSPTRVCLSGLIKNYAIQRVLLETIPWVARQKLPAYAQGNPELYLMCQASKQSMSVALFNCFADSITNLKIHLDRPYQRIECLNCEAHLEGETVTLSTRLYGYSSAAFRVFND